MIKGKITLKDVMIYILMKNVSQIQEMKKKKKNYYQEIRSTRLNHKLSKFHLETFSSVHVFDVRLFRAIKGVFSLLTLAYFFTEKSRCQDAEWFKSRLMLGDLLEIGYPNILVNAGIVKGDDSVRKDDWFEVT